MNYLVDPYELFCLTRPDALNLDLTRLETGTHSRLFKAKQVMDIRPSNIVLGDSRALLGIDVSNKLIGQESSSYNLGVDGATMHEVCSLFHHALRNQPQLKRVVLALDLEMFNSDAVNSPDFLQERLNRTTLPLRDLNASLFSLDALVSSLETVRQTVQGKPNYFYTNGNRTNETLDRLSFDVRWARYVDHEISEDNRETFQLNQKAISEYQDLVDICRERKIALSVFFPPSFGQQDRFMFRSSCGDAMRDARQQLVEIHPIWDFSDSHPLLTGQKGIDNFFDPIHFRKNIGDLILGRMLDPLSPNYPNDFGKLIRPGSDATVIGDIQQ